jgi:EAL domain-containing protein (putative c-di-GMP-specific phosphodiesterase class I)
VRRPRSAADEQIADLLRTAKESLHLSVAFLSRLDGTTQHLEVVESSVPLLFREGTTQRQETSFCQAILDGRLPAVIPDVRNFPVAMALPAARLPRIRSYVSTPVHLSDGTLYGTFCAAGLTSDKELAERDEALMQVLARAAAVVIEPGVREQARRDGIEDRLDPLLRAGGPRVLLQPIVDIVTGRRIGSEALSRFPLEWRRTPDVVFAEAHSVGRGHELELLALRRAAGLLDRVEGYVSMNVSPATLLTPEVLGFLAGLSLPRVLLELSEHDPVEDYDALRAALAPLRAEGLRLAVDDVGAGFSSLRHIVVTAPDVIKLDRTLVDGVARDRVLHSLVRSLVDFASGLGAVVVAEGVETAEDARALHDLRVGYGQGWFWGRAVPADLLEDRFDPVVPARERVPLQRHEDAGVPLEA